MVYSAILAVLMLGLCIWSLQDFIRRKPKGKKPFTEEQLTQQANATIYENIFAVIFGVFIEFLLVVSAYVTGSKWVFYLSILNAVIQAIKSDYRMRKIGVWERKFNREEANRERWFEFPTMLLELFTVVCVLAADLIGLIMQ